MTDKKTAIKEKLATTRTELRDTLDELSAEEWLTPVYSHASSWAIADILRHLTDSENSMTRLMIRIRDGGEGVPPDFDLARWNESRIAKARDKTPADLFADMARNREALFQFIDSLEPEDWDKEGRHGSMRVLSIEQICHLISDHESTHLNDIRQALQREEA